MDQVICLKLKHIAIVFNYDIGISARRHEDDLLRRNAPVGSDVSLQHAEHFSLIRGLIERQHNALGCLVAAHALSLQNNVGELDSNELTQRVVLIFEFIPLLGTYGNEAVKYLDQQAISPINFIISPKNRLSLY